MSIPQANVSKPAARQGIQKVELTFFHVNPPGERQQAGSVARDPEGGTHMLSYQSPRRMSANRYRGKGSGRCNSLSVISIHRANVSKPATRQGIQKMEPTSCMSIPQANVSKPAARQVIWKSELTSCWTNPPGTRQPCIVINRSPRLPGTCI